MQQLNEVLFDECRRNENRKWTEGIYLIKSGNHIIVNNLINSLNHFVEFTNSHI